MAADQCRHRLTSEMHELRGLFANCRFVVFHHLHANVENVIWLLQYQVQIFRSAFRACIPINEKPRTSKRPSCAEQIRGARGDRSQVEATEQRQEVELRRLPKRSIVRPW